MNRQDEIHAHALGVAMPCHDCRDMDDMHREHIERLKAEIAECAEMEEFLVIDAAIAKENHQQDMERASKEGLAKSVAQWKRAEHWKLIAFAGWLLAGILAAADLIGSGR